MVNRNPRDRNHEPTQLLNDKVPKSTGLKQATPSINKQLRLMTPTNVSRSIRPRIPKLILNPNPTLRDSSISGMTLTLGNLTQERPNPHLSPAAKFSKTTPIQQPANSPSNIEVIMNPSESGPSVFMHSVDADALR